MKQRYKFSEIEKMKKRIRFGLAVSIISISQPSMADEWDNFYSKYNGKFFVISYDQQDYFKSGAVGAPLKRETGFSLVSPDTVRRIYRQENKVTGHATAPGEMTIRKGSSTQVGSTSERNSVEIVGNKFILNFTGNGETISEIIINASGNSCNAKFNTYEYNGRTSTPKRSNIVCKVVSAY